MTTLPHPSPSASSIPAIQTRQHLDTVLENIVQLQLERDELDQAQENEIASIRQKYRAPLAEMERYLDQETSWVENWARENRDTFGEAVTLECAHATIGFQAIQPRIERASRRWTWARIAQTLAGLSWGARYLRQPAPEVDKEALLDDLANLSLVELRGAGIRIIQGERFFIAPHRAPEGPAVVS